MEPLIVTLGNSRLIPGPKGDTGDRGPKGDTGDSGVANVNWIASLESGTLIGKLVLGEDEIPLYCETASNKAPMSHASSASTYGLGSTANYGHVKTVNGLTQASHADGLALSAYQGKVLKDLVDGLTSGKAPTSHASSASTYGLGSTSNYGHVKTVNGLTQASHANGLALSAYQGKVLKDLVDAKVPLTRTVNGKALSSNISLAASDVGAVPTSRTVNGMALSSNITLNAAAVGARPSNWTPTYSDVGAPPKSHASTASTYGLGTTANYGHVKLVDNNTTTSTSNGLALHAHQGYVLKGLINGKVTGTQIDFHAGEFGYITMDTSACAIMISRGDASLKKWYLVDWWEDGTIYPVGESTASPYFAVWKNNSQSGKTIVWIQSGYSGTLGLLILGGTYTKST